MERTGKDERKRMIWLVRGEKKKNWGKAKMENWRNSQKSFNLYHFTHDSAEQPSASPSRHDCVPLSLCLSWSTDPKAASCAEVCFDSNIVLCVWERQTDGLQQLVLMLRVSGGHPSPGVTVGMKPLQADGVQVVIVSACVCLLSMTEEKKCKDSHPHIRGKN